MTENNDFFDAIDIRELFSVLLHKLWAIILSVLFFAGAAFGYTYFFVPPEYQANTLLYVNNSGITVGNGSFSISASDLNASSRLVSTYVVILKSRMVLNDVIETADLNYSYSALSNMITASSVNSTEVLRITVTAPNPNDAEKIANTIAEILPQKIADIISGSDARIVDYAVVPASRYSPSYTKNTSVGGLIGAALSVVVIVLMYLFDENIHSEDYLSQVYPDIPVLAVIPNMNPNRQRGGYGYRYGNSYGSRYYKSSYYSRRSYASPSPDGRNTKPQRISAKEES